MSTIYNEFVARIDEAVALAVFNLLWTEADEAVGLLTPAEIGELKSRIENRVKSLREASPAEFNAQPIVAPQSCRQVAGAHDEEKV